MARATTTPPPPTLVLFVRHGQTPTTGKVLPGRARGLHLARRGRKTHHARLAGNVGGVSPVQVQFGCRSANPVGSYRPAQVVG